MPKLLVRPIPFKGDLKLLEKTIEYDEQGKTSQVVSIERDKKYILFGKEISVGEEISISSPMRLEKRELLREKLRLFSEGDVLLLKFDFVGENNLILIYKRYSDAKPEDYIESEILLGKGLNDFTG